MATTIKAKGFVAPTTSPQDNKFKWNATAKNLANQQLSSNDCDRYKTCSANICPLDHDSQKRVHHSNDRVCFYLIEAQKINAKALFEHTGRWYIYT